MIRFLTLPEPPRNTAERDILSNKSTLGPNQSAHIIDARRIRFVDGSKRRDQGAYGEVARAILHTSNHCIHPTHLKMVMRPKKCKDVAVKMLFSRGDLDDMEKKFNHEACVWSKLRHENVLELLGHLITKSEGRFWLVCPWVCAGNACVYLKAQKPALIEKLRLAAGAAKGLHYLHTCTPPICHGDIKAANVLINGDQAQLCDFGLARVIEVGTASRLPTGSDIVGTTRWFSPELLDGISRTPRSDVWAWGWLVWEIMTGEIPFSDIAYDGAVVKRIVMGFDIPRLPIGYEAAQQLMAGCLTHDRHKRWTMADAMPILQQAIDCAVEVGTPSNVVPIAPNVHVSVNSSPPSSPLQSVPQRLAANSDPSVAPNGLPSRAPPRGDYLWRMIVGFKRFCCCGLCGSHSEATDEARPNIDVELAPLPPSNQPGRQGGPGTTPGNEQPAVDQVQIERPDAVPNSLENVAGIENAIPGFPSDALSAHNLLDVRPVPGVPSLFKGTRQATRAPVAIRVSQDLKRALKLIRRGDADHIRTEDEIVDAFRQHVNNAQLLGHPQLITTYGHIISGSNLGVISPWCENGNIRTYLESNPLADLWELLNQIFDGLLFLHAQQPSITHGCLKPENVLIDADGRALLSEIGELPLLQNLVRGITACGRAHDIRWTSPEVLQDAKWGQQFDVYTVGLLGQSLISGTMPYASLETTASVVRAICMGDSPFEIGSQTSSAWRPAWDLLKQCSVTEPARRPTMSDVSSQFEACRVPHRLQLSSPEQVPPPHSGGPTIPRPRASSPPAPPPTSPSIPQTVETFDLGF